MDAAAFNAGWGLGQEMARAGLEAERLPPPERGAFWRHIFSIFFCIFAIFFLDKNLEKYSRNMKTNMEKYEHQYGKIQ